MPIKLLALDLDGTLLHTDKTISGETLETLRRCREQGVLIVLATARSESSCRPYLDLVEPDFAILNGGGLVLRREEELYRLLIGQETSDRLVRELTACPSFASISVEAPAGYYVEQRPESTWHYTNSEPLSLPFRRPAFKITAELDCPQEAEPIARRHPDCTLVRFTGTKLCRFVPRDAEKFSAIRHIAALSSIPLSDIAAFGDDLIDLEMIRGCGWGIAMENAIPEVKAAASHICPANDQDGVAQWLNRFLPAP